MAIINPNQTLDFDFIFEEINLDKKTLNHCLRVGKLSHFLANLCNFSEDIINLSHLCGRYHDIGKANEDIKELLVLERPLSDDEKKLMKLHTNIGCDLLDFYGDKFNFENVNFSFFKAGVLNHHESFDGTGYFGLSGEKIPLWARVVTVCDYFDALMEKRSYKKSFSFEKSMLIMKENSHVYDPNIFNIFLDNSEKIESGDISATIAQPIEIMARDSIESIISVIEKKINY